MDLAALPLFSSLSENDLFLLKEKVVGRRFAKGSTVFLEGQETDGFYVLVSGQAKVFMLHKDGREKTLDFLSEGDVLGEMTLFGSELRSASVEAMEDTTFAVIPRDEFQSLIMKIPTLSILIIQVLSKRLRQANHQIQEMAFYNARNRVIFNLLYLSEKYGREHNGKIRINIRITHAELAKLAGVSRETVTKVLSGLQEHNFISITQRHLEIIDRQALAEEIL